MKLNTETNIVTLPGGRDIHRMVANEHFKDIRELHKTNPRALGHLVKRYKDVNYKFPNDVLQTLHVMGYAMQDGELLDTASALGEIIIHVTTIEGDEILPDGSNVTIKSPF
jgi:hypothetical protein